MEKRKFSSGNTGNNNGINGNNINKNTVHVKLEKKFLEMTVTQEYVSVSPNNYPQAIAWSENNLIAIASGNTVVIVELENDSPFHWDVDTCLSKNGKITSLRWIVQNLGDTKYEGSYLVFGTILGKVMLCIFNKKTRTMDRVIALNTNTSSGVTSIDGIFESNKALIAVSNAESLITIFQVDLTEPTTDEVVEPIQRLCLDRGVIPMVVRMCSFNGVKFLAFGGDEGCLHLWTKSKESEEFIFYKKIVGHTDWLRGLDFSQIDNSSEKSCLFLASSGQDALIRVYRISSLGEQDENNHSSFDVSLETVLSGHESHVYSVCWEHCCQRLWSASLDKTIICWQPDTSSGLWTEKVRVGTVGGELMGFVGLALSPNNSTVMASSFHGALHTWKLDSSLPDSCLSTVSVIGGHVGSCVDLDWEPESGAYLMTCGHDRTVRIHANVAGRFVEIARPQIHGYEMSCLAVIDWWRFISGAEEKVLRVFNATRNFARNFESLTGATLCTESNILDKLSEGASLAALGLSNRAVSQDDVVNRPQAESGGGEQKHPKDQHSISFTPVVLDKPPHEDVLQQNTLWCENKKLYGHGNELFSVAVSDDWIASSCRAQTTPQGAILIWDRDSYQLSTRLEFHNLTVTQLAFDPVYSRYLLAVSRDRRWSLWEKVDNREEKFKLIAYTDKKCGVHQRIIWCCAWSADSSHFFTGSRDKRVVIWRIDDAAAVDDDGCGGGDTTAAVSPLGRVKLRGSWLVDDAVTALATPLVPSERCIVAMGFETGVIELRSFCLNGDVDNFSVLHKFSPHQSSVRRLRFSPQKDDLKLASCGDDGFVFIFLISL